LQGRKNRASAPHTEATEGFRRIVRIVGQDWIDGFVSSKTAKSIELSLDRSFIIA